MELESAGQDQHHVRQVAEGCRRAAETEPPEKAPRNHKAPNRLLEANNQEVQYHDRAGALRAKEAGVTE